MRSHQSRNAGCDGRPPDRHLQRLAGQLRYFGPAVSRRSYEAGTRFLILINPNTTSGTKVHLRHSMSIRRTPSNKAIGALKAHKPRRNDYANNIAKPKHRVRSDEIREGGVGQGTRRHQEGHCSYALSRCRSGAKKTRRKGVHYGTRKGQESAEVTAHFSKIRVLASFPKALNCSRTQGRSNATPLP